MIFLKNIFIKTKKKFGGIKIMATFAVHYFTNTPKQNKE